MNMPAANGEEPSDLDLTRAVAGDRRALEAVLSGVQDRIYNLAVRMLWCPHDAADATQEILLKVMTHLATFQHRSSFATWVYRIAVNHLLNIKRSRVERLNVTFDEFAEDLSAGLSEPLQSNSDPEYALLVDEVRVGCTQAMLLCLDRAHRVAYVLAEILDFSGSEAAEILSISEAAFRQRLARARERVQAFMVAHCGLINASAACRCERRVAVAISKGHVVPGAPLFAGRTVADSTRVSAEHSVSDVKELQRIAAIYRSHPYYSAPERILSAFRALFESGRYELLSRDDT